MVQNANCQSFYGKTINKEHQRNMTLIEIINNEHKFKPKSYKYSANHTVDK